MRSIGGILMLCLLLFSHSLRAQESNSPYSTSWLGDGLIIGTGFLNGIVASSFDDTVSALTPAELLTLDKNSINGFDRWAAGHYSLSAVKTSDILLGASLVAPFSLLVSGDVSKDWDKLSLMYVETMLWAAMLPSYTKGTVQRIRPFAYDDTAPLDRRLEAETRRSFFSGHTCLAFSSMVMFSTMYGDYFPESEYKPYVWAGSLLLAGSVGYMRIVAGAHYPTDVIVGALIGSTVGYLIPVLHRTAKDGKGTSLHLFPGGVRVSYGL